MDKDPHKSGDRPANQQNDQEKPFLHKKLHLGERQMLDRKNANFDVGVTAGYGMYNSNDLLMVCKMLGSNK